MTMTISPHASGTRDRSAKVEANRAVDAASMRVAFVLQNYLPYLGGVETQARAAAHRLAAKGRHVEIVAASFRPLGLPRRLAMLGDSLLVPHHKDFDDEGIPVRTVTPGRLQRLRLSPIALRATPRLQRYAYGGLRRMGYRSFRRVHRDRLTRVLASAQVVHCFAGNYLGWLAQEIAAEMGKPFVCSPYVHPQQWGDGPDDVAYYRRSDAVVALIETDRDYLVSLGIPREKVRLGGVFPLLPESVDPAGFRQRHGLGDDPVVLYVGRLMVQKGAPAMLAAAQRIWREQPTARLVFIGPGSPQQSEVFRGCDKRIHYLGRVCEQEKGDALAACDLFCMPSISEILPAVYLEAWSYAKPVIGGLADGLEELITGHGGGINASQNPEELAGAILRMLGDDDLRRRCGEAGRALVRSRFTVDAVTGAYRSIYRELASKALANG